MNGAGAIDRRSPIPFYYQLKQILVAEIESGRFEEGDRLPGEHELCSTFDVSRTVVRQALSELEGEGWLTRRKGRGTFVAPRKVSESLFQSLTGLHEDVTARGGVLRSEVRRRESMPASAGIAAELGINEGEPIILLDRLRLVDGVPWVRVVSYLPHALCPRVLEEDLEHGSLYALLEGACGVKISHGRRTVEAVAASAEVAGALGMEERDPVLLLRSTSYGEDGRPVEHFVAHHRGDLSRFEVNLLRRRGDNGSGAPVGAPTMIAGVTERGTGPVGGGSSVRRES